MSRLTKTARKTYAGLMIGNLLIILAGLLLIQYIYYVNIRPVVPPATVHSILKFVYLIKSKPESQWSTIMRRNKLPWSKITLSATPVYQDNALLTLRQPIVYDLLRQDKMLKVSVFVKEGTWLNIRMHPPLPNQLGIYLTISGLLVILLCMLFLINYWAVKILNQPVQTLIQSLKYIENREHWSSIPITGNSDQKLIFEKINRLQENVRKLLDNRTRVFTAISHDLRTPLTRLKLRAEYLEEQPIFAKIMMDIHEMEMMIRETLDYFREANSEEKNQRFDMVAMLSSLTADAAELHYEVLFNTDVDKLIYLGRVSQLKRAFSNLINNAIYYGQSALIHLQQFDHQIEVTISDKGPGLSEKEMEQVFMPFYRGEQSRSRATGGTGLGLTIAKEIIQAHQGTITLTNRVQGGLQVTVSLPFTS
ncbi:sensor histidine kinase [Legionella oakridgensis]|uniref:histidine kinase n=2 Tax=Legionella oakridgensis TaxID=29423 RepID=W0BDW6_9GAMM|nr:ATP-binding protein [Legionella oakridgensis]AHE68065.1 signal transduction histidine kinase [Legionella oakridgensis ATCC 33761 = DSM 21215]ETO92413.1 signal transduction histidine kinase [Legionella oakridgensis RV-2-2007]KTD44540.1 sensor histidine kinase [Legionella oakridgensis]STY21049.1 sensor histidine kinase [Legionella longbeachae]